MKIVTLTEQDLNRIIDRVINEQSIKSKNKYVSNQVIYRDNKRVGTYSGNGYWQQQGTQKKFVRDGYGRMKRVDGDVYEGQWKYDKRNGYGRYKWTDGDVYEGNYLNGNMHGKGTYKWASGNIYKGEFKYNHYNGYAKVTFFDNSYYEGKWKNNEKNGYGTYVNKYKIKFSGIWVDNKLDGKYLSDLDKITTEQPKSSTNNQTTTKIDASTTKSDASTSTCPQPTEPQYNYVGDNNYQYAKSGDCWWAFRKSNSKWINLTERLKTNPGYQSTIDNLNNGGTNLTPIKPSSEEETTPLG